MLSNLTQRTKNFIELHFIVLLWGFSGILGALISFNAIVLVWWRVFLATLIIIIIAYVKKEQLKVSNRILLKMILVGVIIAIHWLAFYEAIKVSNVSITLAAFSSASFFMSFLEPIFYKRKIIVYEVLFGFIVMLVLMFIFKLEPKYLKGIIYSLIAAFLSGVFSLLNGKLIKESSVMQIAVYEFLTGFLFLTIFMFFTNNVNDALFIFKGYDVLWMMVLCIMCTVYPFISINKLMHSITPYTVVLTVNLEPVYAIVLAYFILGESDQLNTMFYFGAFIIFSTVLLNAILKSKQRKALVIQK